MVYYLLVYSWLGIPTPKGHDNGALDIITRLRSHPFRYVDSIVMQWFGRTSQVTESSANRTCLSIIIDTALLFLHAFILHTRAALCCLSALLKWFLLRRSFASGCHSNSCKLSYALRKSFYLAKRVGSGVYPGRSWPCLRSLPLNFVRLRSLSVSDVAIALIK